MLKANQLTSSEKLKVSLFQIPAQYKTGLAKVSAKSLLAGKKKSINTCILEAINEYLEASNLNRSAPALRFTPLEQYTVRTTDEIKAKISIFAAEAQLDTGIPVTMNAVVNSAIHDYLIKNLENPFDTQK